MNGTEHAQCEINVPIIFTLRILRSPYRSLNDQTIGGRNLIKQEVNQLFLETKEGSFD